MRLTLINQYYRPDISPTALLAASVADHRAAIGDEVTVVTGRGSYAAATAAPAAAGGTRVRVLRTWSPGFGRASLLRRALDQLAFHLTAGWRLATLRTQDVVVAMTSPPYILWVAVVHKLLHPRARVVFWCMDCYPESAECAGLLRPGGLLSRAGGALTSLLLRGVDHVVCLDNAMAERVADRCGGRRRPTFSVVPNWEARAAFPWPVPGSADGGAVDADADAGGEAAAGRFEVLYLGNAGVGHEFGTVLDAAERLRNDPRVRFRFIGGGRRWPELEAAKQQRGLANLTLEGYVEKSRTPALMAAAGAALVTLRDDALGVMSPSKLHAYLAAGLPVAYVGPAGGNVDEAVTAYGCGASLRHGDVDGLVAFLRELSADPAARRAMGLRARAAFEAAYCDDRALPRFDAALSAAAASGPGRAAGAARGLPPAGQTNLP